MNIICYFKEPAAYTVSLKNKIYDVLMIKSRFLENKSLASNISVDSFANNSIIKKIQILWNDSRTYKLVIFNGFYHLELLLLLLFSFIQKNNLKIALDSDTPLLVPNNFFKKNLKKWILNFLFKKKRVYGFSGGTYHHKELFRFYGMQEERIHFLPMVVDVDRFKIKTIKKDRKFTFLYVGRIIDIKNVQQLINAFQKGFTNTNVRLKIVGSGGLFNKLKSAYVNVSNIEFTGAIYGEELVNIYKRSHVFVLPSLFEPWGLVVNEAMASGLPVISSKFVGSNYDLIKGKNTGLIFDPKKEGDLTDKMLDIYQNKTKFNSLSENAYNLMHSHWNYDLYKKQLLSAINKIINA